MRLGALPQTSMSSLVSRLVPRSGAMNVARRFNARSGEQETGRRVATTESIDDFKSSLRDEDVEWGGPGVETPG